MASRLLLLCSALVFVACSGDGDNEEGDEQIVNVYNWSDYIGEDTIEKFEAEFGIKVNYDVYDSGEIVDVKLLAGNTGYDVIIHSNSFSARIAPAGVHEPLDFSRIPNIKHLDPETMRIIDAYPNVRDLQVPYFWGTTGYAYNADMVRERLGDHPMDSGDVLFDPETIAKLADCGVSLLDSPIDVMPMLLAYLGKDPNSLDPEDLNLARDRLVELRPHIRYFSGTKMLTDLPNKEICVAMSWSGDYATAKWRAADAGIDIDLRYTAPKEGTGLWVDGLYIPKDARHKDNAYLFINFIQRPDINAEITNTVNYATANGAAWPLLDPAVRNDPAIFPNEEIMQVMYSTSAQDPKKARLRTRAYVQGKSGMQ
ncbi:MAG: polyamine ABC transporter substrate-binding protein [Woeseiaceae bacterium]